MAEGALFPLEASAIGMRFACHDVLRDVSFVLDGRDRTVVLGANGAGKSILLRVLHGLIAPTSGVVRWAGNQGRPREQAMVFQRPVMLRRSALANIEYALGIQGIDGHERARRAREALERVGLDALAARQARVLSSGEQQRLALARAWALRPRIIFLDEPTASLDPAAAAEVERVIGEIHGAGTAIVMTTHNLGLARRVADDILFLHEGRLAERATTEDFFTAPRSPEAAAFLKGALPWIAHSPTS
jgi:tungstate transport system ATP-binding protein